MLVSKQDVSSILEILAREPEMSLDTETTGLFPYLGDRLFSIIIGTKDTEFYFNFQPYAGVSDDLVLPRSVIRDIGEKILQDPTRTLYLHNSKFDLHMLVVEGAHTKCKIHDTEVVARLLYNVHNSYSLDECTKRIGYKKDDAVKAYIEEHNLYEKYTIGEKEDRKPCYNKVPFEIISKYGLQDARVTFDLAQWQLNELRSDRGTTSAARPIEFAADVERPFSAVLFRLEHRGMRVDIPFCKEAYAYERERVGRLEQEFQGQTGIEFVDSAKCLGPILIAAGDSIGRTEDGRDSISDYVLAECASPIAQLIRDHRDANKRASTYWHNLIHLADRDGFVHADYRQVGARTFRMSCRNPNFQNVTKEDPDEGSTDNSPYPIRRSILPPEGCFLVEIDYKAQEFRLAVDYAREEDLADQIANGFDPHQATADATGLIRKQAKILNFALLYGVGKVKLARMLGCTPEEAALTKARYFHKLPGIKGFLRRAMETAKTRGWVFSWDGRRFYLPDPNEAYKAPNCIIQGGCAGITKNAMVNVQKHIDTVGCKTHMIAQVHDSIVLVGYPDEIGILEDICEIMRRAYPHKILPMDVDMKHSWKNWLEMEKGAPHA